MTCEIIETPVDFGPAGCGRGAGRGRARVPEEEECERGSRSRVEEVDDGPSNTESLGF